MNAQTDSVGQRAITWAKAHPVWAVVIALVVIGVLASPFVSDDEASSKGKDDTKASETKKADEKAAPKKTEERESPPKYDGKAFAAKVLKEMEVNLGGPINDRCDYNDPSDWHCAFDKYTSPIEGRINVYLSFPGDVDKGDREKAAEQARLHTFNLAGFSIENLEQVVSFNEGVDSGTTNRKDVPLLNR